MPIDGLDASTEVERDIAVFVEDALEHLAEIMEDEGITKAELARRLGARNPAQVFEFFASTDPTMRTLARCGSVLGYRLEVSFLPKRRVDAGPYRVPVLGHLGPKTFDISISDIDDVLIAQDSLAWDDEQGSDS